MKKRAAGSVIHITQPLRALAQRFSFLLLVVAAVGLMLLGKVDTMLVEQVRTRVIDAVVPILDAMSRPAATAARAVESARRMVEVYTENDRLREANQQLLQWQQAALRLEAENVSLRNLLKFKANAGVTGVTGRVVADPGGPFVRTVLVNVGRRDGVRKGQAAMAGEGMIGRVVDVGEWSSRVLLITDLNSRIPVLLETSRYRAVLGGDNSDRPRLSYVQPETPVVPGDRVVTSGSGGMFPAGLPIGVVASVDDRVIRVAPLAALDRVEHVRLIDFGLPGGIVTENTDADPLQ